MLEPRPELPHEVVTLRQIDLGVVGAVEIRLQRRNVREVVFDAPAGARRGVFDLGCRAGTAEVDERSHRLAIALDEVGKFFGSGGVQRHVRQPT